MKILKHYLMEKFFGGKYHFTAGSLYCPKCHTRFADVDTGLFPLPNPHVRVAPCPVCKTTVGYAYEFEADFSHADERIALLSALKGLFLADKRYMFNSYVMQLFGIPHFVKNHVDFDLEGEKRKVFSRKCNCGKEIRIVQRRVF